MFMRKCLFTIDERSYRAYKKHSAIELWEDSRKSSVEAELKKIEVINYMVDSCT